MIPGTDETRRADRWNKKRLRLGETDPQCVQCHIAEIPCLRRIKNAKSAYNGMILCDNCCSRNRGFSDRSRKNRIRKFENLGYVNPQCLICNEAEIMILELHHVAGEANSKILAPLCGNCHDIQSDAQEDLPADLRLRDPKRRPLVQQAAFELGLALLFGAVICFPSLSVLKDGSWNTFLGIIALTLVGWAIWNLAADPYFAEQFGSDYSVGVPAPVPA